MFARRFAFIAPVALALAGCGSGGSHETCVDAETTQEYGLDWMTAIGDAKTAGLLTTDQVVEAQGKSYENFGLLQNEDWSGFCNMLDETRADYGF